MALRAFRWQPMKPQMVTSSHPPRPLTTHTHTNQTQTHACTCTYTCTCTPCNDAAPQSLSQSQSYTQSHMHTHLRIQSYTQSHAVLKANVPTIRTLQSCPLAIPRCKHMRSRGTLPRAFVSTCLMRYVSSASARVAFTSIPIKKMGVDYGGGVVRICSPVPVFTKANHAQSLRISYLPPPHASRVCRHVLIRFVPSGRSRAWVAQIIAKCTTIVMSAKRTAAANLLQSMGGVCRQKRTSGVTIAQRRLCLLRRCLLMVEAR